MMFLFKEKVNHIILVLHKYIHKYYISSAAVWVSLIYLLMWKILLVRGFNFLDPNVHTHLSKLAKAEMLPLSTYTSDNTRRCVELTSYSAAVCPPTETMHLFKSGNNFLLRITNSFDEQYLQQLPFLFQRTRGGSN